MRRSFTRCGLRWSMLVTPLMVAVLFPGVSLASVVVAAALLAYDGPYRRSIIVMSAILVINELLFSAYPGVLSLPFVLTAGLLRVATTFVALADPTSSVTWSYGTTVRLAVATCAIVVMLSLGSVCVTSLAYGGGYTMLRAAQVLHWSRILPLWAWAFIVSLVLYRIDVPFKRRTL